MGRGYVEGEEDRIEDVRGRMERKEMREEL